MMKKEGKKSHDTVPLKGQSHEIFDPWFFPLNGTPGCPDSWAKAVLNIDSNSQRNSIRFDPAHMRHRAESIFFVR
jgi:hypothetical protein